MRLFGALLAGVALAGCLNLNGFNLDAGSPCVNTFDCVGTEVCDQTCMCVRPSSAKGVCLSVAQGGGTAGGVAGSTGGGVAGSTGGGVAGSTGGGVAGSTGGGVAGSTGGGVAGTTGGGVAGGGAGATGGGTACVPSCAGKACGASDGCSSTCQSGTCSVGQRCVAGSCQCDATSCASGCCSASGCELGNVTSACGSGGKACAACQTGWDCTSNACACVPNCSAKACGASDGCGGTCMAGTCGSGTHCVSGTCRCDSTTCGGCCSASGQCVSGSTNASCGSGGATCSVCSASQICGGGKSNPCLNVTLLQSTMGGYGTGGHTIVFDPTGQNVYFLDQNNSTTNMQIWKVPTSGGPGVVIAGGLDWPVAIAVDSVNLYWTSISQSTVSAQSLSTGTRRTLATGQYFPMDIVVRDATTVYWSACANSNGTQCSVSSIPVSGGSPTPIYSLSGGGNPDLALLLPNLYVTSPGLRQVVSIAVAPGGSNSIVDGANLSFNGVDAAAGRVAWIAGASANGVFDGVVKGMSVGGSIKTIASGQAPYTVAVDATNAYWVTSSGSNEAIYKAPIAGGSATLVLDNVGTYSIAVDANYVYFLGSAGYSNGLFRTPK